MLKCKDVTDETSNYIEGDLPFGKRIALFLHIFICRNCRHYVQQFRKTVDTVSVVRPQELDATDRQALAKKLHAMCNKSHADKH
jgi:hypothetical protein